MTIRKSIVAGAKRCGSRMGFGPFVAKAKEYGAGGGEGSSVESTGNNNNSAIAICRPMFLFPRGLSECLMMPLIPN